MSRWLSRLDVKFQEPLCPVTAKTDKTPCDPPFVSYVSSPGEANTKTRVTSRGEVSAPPNPDRWCWPHSDAMTGAELDVFSTRRTRLMRWGWIESEAEALAERLVKRDRDKDERASCTECRHFRPGRCGNHGRAGLNVPDLGRDLAVQLQRCPGFTA